jgi:hypothetical protein
MGTKKKIPTVKHFSVGEKKCREKIETLQEYKKESCAAAGAFILRVPFRIDIIIC